MKRRYVELEKSDENIAEQYDNIFEGLQKDAGQNSWDARLYKRGKDWELSFRYIPDRNTIVMEDFGTTGMNKEKWDRYQSLWSTSKAEDDALGARGQGKFLFHYFSSGKLVITETIDETGEYRFSYGTSEEWGEDKTLNDFIPGATPLGHQGSRIWIMDVKKEFVDELQDYRKFMRYTAITWWEIIRNWNATFIVNFNGIDREVELSPPLKIKEVHRIKNIKLKDWGKIKNLVINYCEEDVPEDIRGIAIQRGGMTIVRLPIAAEESFKKRIYGYCNFDSDLEMELKKVELPNHFGFRNKIPWSHVRAFVRREVDDFLQEIRPKRRKKIDIGDFVISQAISMVNSLVGDYAPEVAMASASGGKGSSPPSTDVSGAGDAPPESKPPRKPSSRKPLPRIRIAKFRGNSRRIEYDESLEVDCEVVNSKKNEKSLSLEFKIQHRDGDSKLKPLNQAFAVSGKGRAKINLPVIDFDEKKDKRGEYKATAVLKEDHKKEIHRRSFKFYLDEDPPMSGLSFLNSIQLLHGNDTELEKLKQLPVTDKGILHVNVDHPDFVHMRDLASKNKKQRNVETLLYFVKCGVDGAIQKLLEMTATESQLDENEVRRVKSLCDEMYYEAVRQIEA